MINYIRHDHEFYGVIKLTSGEEIMGTMIATSEDPIDDPEIKGSSVIFVSNPATPKEHPVNKGGEIGFAIGLVKWMMWSDEDFYIVREQDIVTVAPMAMGAVMMYKLWLRKEMGDDDVESLNVPMNENMGLVGKVADLRKRLEDQWTKDQS